MAKNPILKWFKEYLEHGYYPFFMEGVKDYFARLNNVIEKVIYEDIALVFNLRQTTLPILKKIIWLVATTDGLTPNIEKISGSLGVSREVIYYCLEYLNKANLLHNVFPAGGGIKLLRKPGKIYMNNSNLLFCVNATLLRQSGQGGVRETFFANQVASCYKLNSVSQGDFLVEDRYHFEVGGRSKDFSQLKNVEESYLALDEIEIGFKNKIPLYLFGFLY